jgi:hypothetical protein
MDITTISWIFFAVLAIGAVAFVLWAERKARRDTKWREQEKRNTLDFLLSPDWDENSYS